MTPFFRSACAAALLLSPQWLTASSFTFETDVEFTAAGDFNGDSYPDFIIVDKELGLYRIGYGSAAGSYTQASALPTGLSTVDALAVGKISDSAATPVADRFAVCSILGNRVHTLSGSSSSYNAPSALHLLGSGPDAIALLNIPGSGDTAHEDIFGTCRYEPGGIPVKLRQLRHTGTATTQLTSTDLLSAHRAANAVQLTATSGVAHVVLIGGAGSASESLRLYRPDAGGAVLLHNRTLTGTGNRYVHARFGSETAATFVAYRPLSADVQAFVVSDLGGGSYEFGSAVTTTLPAPVKALYVVQQDASTARLVVLHTDGSAALYHCAAGSITLDAAIDVSAEAGSPSGVVPTAEGKYQMLFSADGTGRSSRFINMSYSAGSWGKTGGGDLAVAAAHAAYANVIFMSQRPFLDDAPQVLASLRAGDWTTAASVLSGSPTTASTTAETFSGSSVGLANPSLTTLGSVPGSTVGTLTNQVLSNFSATSLTPAQGEKVDNVTIDPPAGSYAGSVRFTLASSGGHSLYYRTSSSAAFSPYTVPQRIYLDATVEYFSTTAAGQRSAIQTASYDMTEEAGDQDSDSDGVPDFVEVAQGLDPEAGQDSDGDGISDLRELIEGTDPNDDMDKPDHTLLNGTDAQLHLSVTPAPYDGEHAVSTSADTGTEVRAHTLGGSLLGYGTTNPTAATVKASPLDAAQRLATVSTPAHYALVYGTERPRTAVEAVGLVPLPGATGPTVNFTFNTSASASSQVNSWITAAQTAYAAPAATAVSLDHFDSLALVLVERRLTTLLRTRGSLTATQFANLTPFRTEADDNHRFLSDSDIASIEHGTGESLLLQSTLTAVETAVANAGGDAGITVLRALVVDLYRIASAMNDGSTSVGLPLDVLRSFINSSPHALPTTGAQSGFNTHKTLSAAELTAAGNAVDQILASLPARSSSTFTATVDLALDAASADTLVRHGTTPSIAYRLLDQNGDAFDLPDTFDLTTGTVLSITGYTDLGSSSGISSVEVISIAITALPATAALADTDGDLLPDDWEQLFFGSMTPSTMTAGDASGYSALQEYFSGTDPRDASSTPTAAVADFSMRRVSINPVAGNQLEVRWQWPNAYLSPVAFTLYESDDLVNWVATSHSSSTFALDTQRSIFTKPLGAKKFYMVAARLR